MIKDYSIQVNLGEVIDLDKGIEEIQSRTIVTEKITGYLRAIVVKSNLANYNIKISISDSINLLDERNIAFANVLIPLKTDHYNVNTKDYSNPDFWCLNDELTVEFSGRKDTEATIILRYDDGL